MKTGTVKVTALSGKGNKIFRSGDVVKESNFPEGNWKGLVSGGYITEDVVAVPEVVESTSLSAQARSDASQASAVLSMTANENSIPAFDAIDKKGIKALLTEKGIAFDDKMNKQALYDLLK
jgi:hypothetical protein